MLKNQRHLQLIHYIDLHQFAKVEELAQLVDVSEITVRRDINELDEKGLVHKVHGGATSITIRDYSNDIELHTRNDVNSDIKDQIAKSAASLVKTNAVVYLDAGTSVSRMIPYLKDKHVTVYTHGLHHVDALVQYGIECYVIGGFVKPTTRAAVGGLSTQYLKQMNFDQAFIGFNALDVDFGFSTPDEMEAVTKSTIIAQSSQVYFIGDSSKFNKKSSVRFASSNDGILITDQDPGKSYKNYDIKVQGER
ncbi:DeoR/GlpR transcriptional regulator [Erysipelothrix amsterdamensis]|uniref:DeoR/GlpR transcriptional regulator n=1 Tax=Erysipelothrix amsterdamensis TaxID=2929157 RepID=A0AAU9VGU7_9FIRM|nr:DeoR/GlpR transcriptional regulator [Erysipelothrix sp. A18Y020d]CAH2760667.1 hypothetical protein ERYAMS_00003 [Erysipelothrix sp. A18Y020d]